MEKRILKILAGCAILGLVVLASCRKVDGLDNLKVVNYDAEFAIPLFTTKASFQDILNKFDNDTYVEIGPDQLITLFYKGDVAGRTSLDIFESLSGLFGFPIPFTDTIFPLPFQLPNGVEIDYTVLKKGTFDYGYGDGVAAGWTDLVVTLPDLTRNGEPFRDTTTYFAGGIAGSTGVGPFDLTGYTLTPVNGVVEVHYHAYRQSTGIRDTLEVFFIKIDDFEFSYTEGYLGTSLYDVERDTIVIDFFENWTRGDVWFVDPKINLIIENSFGFPVQSKSTGVYVFNVDGGIDSLQSIFLDSVVVDYPSLSEVGQTKYTHFAFNKDNSNIDTILGNGPIAIDYDFDAVSNPDSITTIRGFLTDESQMNVQVEVELPMYGNASGFESRDTFNINFDGYQEFNEVEFKIITENGIPLDVGLQIYFADKNGVVLDSLFTPSENILEAAPVNGAGLPTAIAEKTTFTTFEGARFDNIKSAKKALLRASYSTVNNGGTMVKILSTQEVEIRMGMKIGVGG